MLRMSRLSIKLVTWSNLHCYPIFKVHDTKFIMYFVSIGWLMYIYNVCMYVYICIYIYIYIWEGWLIGMWPISVVGGRPRQGSHYHRSLLCWSSETAMGENLSDLVWEADKRRTLPPGQCTGIDLVWEADKRRTLPPGQCTGIDLVWEADKRRTLPPGQCTGTHIHSGHGC